MASRMEMFGLFPVQGLSMHPHEPLSADIFDRDWFFFDATNQIKHFSVLIPGSAAMLNSNLAVQQKRQNASAFLVVKRHLPIDLRGAWDELRPIASNLVGALNFSLLNTSNRIFVGQTKQELPTPIWIPKFPEIAELPLVFDRSRVRMSGHTDGSMGWCDRTHIDEKPVTNAVLQELLSQSPLFIRRLANKATKPDSSIDNAVLSLCDSFNSATIGQFTSQCLAALDVLFAESDSGRWSTIESHVRTILGKLTNPERIKSLFKVRHDFVHRNAEPSDLAVKLRALAAVVATISSFSGLVERYGVLAAHHILAAGHQLQQAELDRKSGAVDQALQLILPAAPLPKWVVDWVRH